MKVFVYGSLKEDKWNHGLLRGSTFINGHVTSPEYTMLNLGAFPGVIEGGKTAIHGELYEIDDIILTVLDRLEGHPNFYKRKEISTPYGDAWIYILQDVDYAMQHNIVESGDWK